jgi:hypothetical protein
MRVKKNRISKFPQYWKRRFAKKQMYGLTFKERNDLPVYHPDVKGMKYMILMKINRNLLFGFLRETTKWRRLDE